MGREIRREREGEKKREGEGKGRGSWKEDSLRIMGCLHDPADPANYSKYMC